MRKNMATRGFTNNRKNCSKTNERIENTYTRSGRIANPTEQVFLPWNDFLENCNTVTA